MLVVPIISGIITGKASARYKKSGSEPIFDLRCAQANK
jgi:hypothetical protein